MGHERMSLTPHNNLCEVSSALAFYRSENQGLARLSAWPQLIHVVKNGAGVQAWTRLTPQPSFQMLCHQAPPAWCLHIECSRALEGLLQTFFLTTTL